MPAGWRPTLRRHLPTVDLDRVRIRAGLPWWTRFAPIRVGAIALPRSIRVRSTLHTESAADAELLAHELCHLAQWRRHGRLAFLVRYVGGYARNRLGGMAPAEAYRSIPLEMEARQVAARIRRDLERPPQAG